MKLYYAPGACSLSPHIVSREAGLAVDLVKYERGKPLADGRAYTTVNPKGQVPALELDDGGVLTEGTAIVQYLADRKPESGLAPTAGTMERYRLQEWLNYVATEIHKGFWPPFNPKINDELKAVLKENLTKRFAWLAEQLATRQFLLGERFTVADAYLYSVTRWAKRQQIELPPALAAYMERVAARPAVKAALAAEGLQ